MSLLNLLLARRLRASKRLKNNWSWARKCVWSARLVGTEQSSVSAAVEAGKVRSSSAKSQRSFSAACKITRNDRATEPVLSAHHC